MLMSHKILYSNHKADFYQDTASLDFQEYGKINPTGTMMKNSLSGIYFYICNNRIIYNGITR